MFLQNFRETGRADANAACPYRAGHDKGRLWGVSGLEVVIDGDWRVQTRGGGCVQEEQAAGVLQIEYHEILFGAQDADTRDAALRVIGDCDGAAFVQIVGQGDLSGVRVDAPRRFDLVPLVIPTVSKLTRTQVVPARFAVPRGGLVALVSPARPAGRAGQVKERPIRRERAVGVQRPDNLGAAPRKYAPSVPLP